MKQKIFVITLVSIFMLILGACSGKTDDSSSSDSGSSDKPVEIDFWYGLGSEADKKMKEIVQEFNESQDEVIVNPVAQADYNESYQKVQAGIASGQAPGVFIAEISMLKDLANKQALAPLDQYVEADDNFNESDFLEVMIEPGKIDDTLYALPGYGTTQVMYYRKDIYEEAGIDPKEAYSSWENLAEASKELQEKGLVEYGHLPMWNQNNLIDIAFSNGGSVLNSDGTEVLIDSPEWIEAWDFIRKQVHEEKTMKIISGGQGWEYWYKTIDEVMHGKAAGYTGSSGDKGDLDSDIIGSIPQPGLGGNEGKPYIAALFMSIPNVISDEEKEAAYKWMSYFTSPEVNGKWAQAIGYIPVRKSTMEVPEYAKFIEEEPWYGVPYEQAQSGTPEFIDPTGGKILDALSIAADKLELQNVPAAEALAEAKEVAQKALDEVNSK